MKTLILPIKFSERNYSIPLTEPLTIKKIKLRSMIIYNLKQVTLNVGIDNISKSCILATTSSANEKPSLVMVHTTDSDVTIVRPGDTAGHEILLENPVKLDKLKFTWDINP